MRKELSFISFIYSKKTIRKLQKQTMLLGVSSKINPILFLKQRLFITILLFSILVIYLHSFIYAFIYTLIFYFVDEYVTFVDPIKIRRRELEREAIPFFEVFVLSLESGENLQNALDTTCENIDSELSREFQNTLQEIELGKGMEEALKNMRKRIPSDSINNIILTLSQTSVFGGNIVDVMYEHINFLSNERTHFLKGKISSIPTKISILSVLFFIPIILLLILGPILINLLK